MQNAPQRLAFQNDLIGTVGKRVQDLLLLHRMPLRGALLQQQIDKKRRHAFAGVDVDAVGVSVEHIVGKIIRQLAAQTDKVGDVFRPHAAAMQRQRFDQRSGFPLDNDLRRSQLLKHIYAAYPNDQIIRVDVAAHALLCFPDPDVIKPLERFLFLLRNADVQIIPQITALDVRERFALSALFAEDADIVHNIHALGNVCDPAFPVVCIGERAQVRVPEAPLCLVEHVKMLCKRTAQPVFLRTKGIEHRDDLMILPQDALVVRIAPLHLAAIAEVLRAERGRGVEAGDVEDPVRIRADEHLLQKFLRRQAAPQAFVLFFFLAQIFQLVFF